MLPIIEWFLSIQVSAPQIAIASLLVLGVLYLTGTLQKLLAYFYGNFTGPELVKFGLLSVASFSIIGSYWTLRSIKDAFFDTLIGYCCVPYAKLITVLAMIPLIWGYTKLVDCMTREKLFWIVCGFYASLFVIFGFGYTNLASPFFALGHGYIGKVITVIACTLLALALKKIVEIILSIETTWIQVVSVAVTLGAAWFAYSKYGFAQLLSSGDSFLAMGRSVTVDGVQLYDLSKLLGWLAFVMVETMGGVIVPLFWSYAHSTTTTEMGKRGYPLIGIAMQSGNLAGPTMARYAEYFGFFGLLSISATILMIVPIAIYIYKSVVPHDLRQTDGDGSVAKKKTTGAGEGLRLMAKHKYLMGLAFVATVYEVVGTLIDFQFKMAASSVFAKEALASYLAMAAQWTAIVGLVFSILGTSIVIRKLGVRFSLLLYPTLLGLVVLMVRFSPVLGILFWAMVFVKMLSYALNNPVKEFMYIPTSKDVKFKVKAVIDGFGGKAAKGIGSVINAACSANPAMLVAYGSIASLGIIGVWIIIAMFVGQSYDQLIEEKKILD
ncbi:hypothetical protein FJ366_01400 [Candidatus Dependentiae bacterium]|nr:hypothetical protein [Candidatus Dependentiae bacterium]